MYLVVQSPLLLLDVMATVAGWPNNDPRTPLDPAEVQFRVTVTTRLNLTAAATVRFVLFCCWW